MEKQEQKKEWVTPELIVLVRSKPEEAVLTGCKTGVGTGGAPGTIYVNCSTTGCAKCVLHTDS